MQAPNANHWFGTDDFGRDLFARILYGSRYSLFIGITVSAIAMVLGMLIGASCAYFGGVYDALVMRLMDAIICIPSMLLMLALAAAFGKGMNGIIASLIIVNVPGYARIIRSIVLGVVHQEYVEAAVACGTPHWKIILRHVLPNCFGPILVDVLMSVAGTIMAASSLSFLGMGIQVPAPEWGAMLSQATKYLQSQPYLAIFPGMAMPSTPRIDERKPHMNQDNIISVKGLRVVVPFKDGYQGHPVDRIDFDIPKGKTVGLVGESGCGKSMTARCLMRLLDEPIYIEEGSIEFEGRDLVRCTEKEMQQVRGSKISMIFQEPMTALNPSITVGKQVREAILLHEKIGKAEAKRRVIEMFHNVGIPDPEERYRSYPHQLSGGLRQRICIAMAMVLHPEFLIADEPTTALDVTVEAQILALMKHLQQKNHTSILMITHNLGVVADICDEVNVMYAGQIVEHAQKAELFRHPAHPYTQGLMKAVPRIHGDNRGELFTIEGTVPPLRAELPGCRFAERCPYATQQCRTQAPQLRDLGNGHLVRCFREEDSK